MTNKPDKSKELQGNKEQGLEDSVIPISEIINCMDNCNGYLWSELDKLIKKYQTRQQPHNNAQGGDDNLTVEDEAVLDQYYEGKYFHLQQENERLKKELENYEIQELQTGEVLLSCKDEIKQLQAELKSATTWISVDDRLPEDEGTYETTEKLVHITLSDIKPTVVYVRKVRFFSAELQEFFEDRFNAESEGEITNVVAWKERSSPYIPTPPKSQDKEGQQMEDFDQRLIDYSDEYEGEKE